MLRVDVQSLTYATDTGPLRALEAVSLHVADGEFVCLTGPSGCGKTSLLRIVLGLETRYQGQAAAVPAPVAAMFQEPRLLPWRTVAENVALALAPGDGPAHAALPDLYRALGIEAHTGFYPAALSGGLARRAALARAFATSPRLLVLDEPFVSLDAATAGRLRDLLIRLWSGRGMTALMVTHDLDEALALADRIEVMAGPPGRLRGSFAISEPRGTRDIDALRARFQAAFPAA
ncbi:MAG: ATP-binding cassette domain-containing protein [Rhodobacteraceae bacterium]|nr:ATP-binding cassette domain-containing protein [Paracoccaceae bacterium]